jgi:putative ATPase
MDSLFDIPAEDARKANEPLAVRMRPRTLEEVVGQEHLTGAGAPIRQLVERDAPMSLVRRSGGSWRSRRSPTG